MAKAFECVDVVKTYRDFQLGPLNISLEPGIVLGYIGPNGAGKTTTMHCLSGLVRAEQGRMTIFGRSNDPNSTAWKQDIGYVGDVHVFYERWTGEKNLKFISRFYDNWSDKRALELAKRFELPLQKRARDLSTGNRVKLSLVAALAHSPKLLLLDEPTAGLDPVVRAEVLDTLFEVLEDGERSIFYSTHILSDISRLADELAFIRSGTIILRTAKDDLTGRYRRITFSLEAEDLLIEHASSQEREGTTWQIVTADAGETLKELHELGAEKIQESRMTIDEIAVQILKNRSEKS
ncbi:ABC transporter ATP-binding protein [bacterium]|nr:ABC transporter ATP-binding protein [bacterium]